MTRASSSVARLNGPCRSRHWSQARFTKSAGTPAAVTCKFPFTEIASRRDAAAACLVSSRSSMCHPNVETWAWICVATASIPGARSPDNAFTSCQALTWSSKSNPAPLVDRSVAGAGFTLSPRDDFSFELFLDAVVVNKDVASSHAAFLNSSGGFRSGFSQTSSFNSQSRVVPVQRSG